MNKPVILFINGAQFGHSSGHYFYCKYLRKDFDIHFICFDRGLEHIELQGVKVYYISFAGSMFIRMNRFLRESINISYSLKPEVLFITYFNFSFILAILCHAKKTVLDIRTGSLSRNKFIRLIQNKYIFLQAFFFNSIIILSESLRGKLKISIKKSKIISLGAEIYYEGNHSADAINLLYLGSLDNRNIDITIRGLSHFIKRNPSFLKSIKYSIVGFGSEVEISKLQKCIEENGLEVNVFLEGRKSIQELPAYFRYSNIGLVFVPQLPEYDCQPSTKLYEYLLSGMPVLATRTYENSQIVHKRNGVLIEDTESGFSYGLEELSKRLDSFIPGEIRESAKSYEWKNIVENDLKGFLLSLMK
jgi:glycosyltransferase involved in cell wall biosynthesis